MNQPQWAHTGKQQGQIRSLYQCQCTGPHSLRLLNWRVVHYRCNHSAFNGYRHTCSDYSAVTCEKCGRVWRTKAKYVDNLPMMKGVRV